MSAVTKDQVRAALQATLAVSEAIRELKEVPSGLLYAQCGDISLEVFNGIIRTLKGAGLVAESNHLLMWVGPEIAS